MDLRGIWDSGVSEAVLLYIVCRGILGGPGIMLYLLDPFIPCIIPKSYRHQNGKCCNAKTIKLLGGKITFGFLYSDTAQLLRQHVPCYVLFKFKNNFHH